MRRRVERRGPMPALDDTGLSASLDLTPQLLRRDGRCAVRPDAVELSKQTET